MSILGQLQFRRDTAANWSSVNPILLSGELGIETDSDKFKLGDGVTAWNALPYGGIKGDTGAAGANGIDGISPTVTVGATTVINPNQNPSATDVDAGPNADIRFSLPRAREVNVSATNTVSPGTAASVGQTADAEGDVNLTFNIPRGATGWSPVLSVVTDGERRVLRLVNYVGGEGTAPTIPTDNYIGATGLTNLANAVDIRGATGATGAAGATPNAFTNIAVTGQNTVVADQGNDTLTLVAGANITITTNEVTDSITISSTSVATNSFGIVTGNTGTATAELPADTLAITGGTGISTAATDTPDGLVITNTDTGSAARTAHEAAADPHPQYLTQTEADALYQPAGGGAVSFVKAVHTATQANSTTTPADLTGQVFTVPPGKTLQLTGILAVQAAAATTGVFYGFRVVQGAGASGPALGSWRAIVPLTGAAAATSLEDGDTINATAGATVSNGVLGTGTSGAINNVAQIILIVHNTSNNANTTVALQFRSEVAGSAVTVQIGTAASGVIG